MLQCTATQTQFPASLLCQIKGDASLLAEAWVTGNHACGLTESQMVRVGRDLIDYVVPTPCQRQRTFHQTRLFRAPSNPVFNFLRDGESTVYLGNLPQCLTTFIVKVIQTQSTMPQQFTQITLVRLSAWKCFNLFTNGLAHCKLENRNAMLASSQAGEANSDSVTTVVQTRHWLTHFRLCCCSHLIL